MALNLERVLISDEVDQKCVTILENNGIKVVKNTKLTKEELIAEIPNYEGLIVRSATKVTADVIAAGKKLKIIGRAGTGVDNIDCEAATAAGVIVMNTPGGNTMSAAEHTCALLTSMSRHIAEGTASLRAGRWDRKKLMGNEVYGKTLAIIGLGRIGREVATRMQAFGMTTIGFDPLVSAAEAAEFNTEWLELKDIWPRADYVTVHVPLIPPTKNMINDDVFSKCKKGMRVINCARGGIIDEAALLRALNSGQCGGAGLDVFLEEPPKDLSLVNHHLVTCTPHLGASTVEAQTRVAEEIAQQFVDMTQGKSLFGAINAQALSNALSADTQPWVALGSAIGNLGVTLGGQVNKDSQLSIISRGSELEQASGYLGAALLVGLLKPQSTNGLNLVNAPAMAKKMGLDVSCQNEKVLASDANTYPSVTVNLTQSSGTMYKMTGTVAGGMPMLKEINGAKFTQGAPLSGNLVVYKGAASPKVLSSVVATICEAGNAVTSLACSEAVKDESWAVIQVATPIGNIEQVKSLVTQAVQLSI